MKTIYYEASVWELHERQHHHISSGPTWEKHSSRIRAELHVEKDSAPWTSKADIRLSGVSNSARQRDLLNVAWEARVAWGKGCKRTDDLKRDFWLDLSQTVTMKPWTDQLKGFRGRGHMYSFEMDRCLDPVDEMRMLGWPKSSVISTPPGDVLYMAADSTSLPMTTLVPAAIWTSVHGLWNEGFTRDLV